MLLCFVLNIVITHVPNKIDYEWFVSLPPLSLTPSRLLSCYCQGQGAHITMKRWNGAIKGAYLYYSYIDINMVSTAKSKYCWVPKKVTG